MKVPISENEMGLVRCTSKGWYHFYRNGNYIYEEQAKKKSIFVKGRFMSFSNFKKRYPKETNNILIRRNK